MFIRRYFWCERILRLLGDLLLESGPCHAEIGSLVGSGSRSHGDVRGSENGRHRRATDLGSRARLTPSKLREVETLHVLGRDFDFDQGWPFCSFITTVEFILFHFLVLLLQRSLKRTEALRLLHICGHIQEAHIVAFHVLGNQVRTLGGQGGECAVCLPVILRRPRIAVVRLYTELVALGQIVEKRVDIVVTPVNHSGALLDAASLELEGGRL